MKRVTRATTLGAALVAVSGCLFAPDIAKDGYVACASDKDCDAGRTCSENLCAPPPWNDEKFEARRALLVKNVSVVPMAAGAAVPVVVGAGGLLSLKDVSPDFRITDFDLATKAWKPLPVGIDREADRFTLWIPAQRDVAPGKSDVLGYLESDTADKTPNVLEDPAAAFGTYDGFDALDTDKWRVHGAPNLSDGVLNVGDGQTIAFRAPLTPPVEMTALVRVNGITCDQVFIGLIGDDQSLFPVGPEAGLFIHEDLAAKALLATAPDQTPTEFGDGITAKTSFQRVTVAVDRGFVSVRDDDDVADAENDLHPAFGDAPMYMAVQVHGACSVDVDAVWATPLPQPPPEVSAGPLLHFTLFN